MSADAESKESSDPRLESPLAVVSVIDVRFETDGEKINEGPQVDTDSGDEGTIVDCLEKVMLCTLVEADSSGEWSL